VRVDVVLTADAVVPGGLDGRTALVVDVLRASTTIVTALGNGALAVVVVADAAAARRRLAETTPGNGLLLAGERRGDTLPGFDLGNSPLEMTGARVRGRTLVFTTSNGTRALLACRGAAAVAVAGLVNAAAAARWAAAGGRDVTIVCSGERGARSLEDHVCAGLIVEDIARLASPASLSEAACEAAAEARRYGRDVGRLGEDSTWARHLRRSGRGDDVTACLRLDTSTLVPLFLPGVDKVVAGNP
jgi:2-phosphosulfolactate phosphatase